MKKKTLLFVVLASLVLILVTGFYVIRLQGATCKIGKDISCEGPCCKVTTDGCIAGPCAIIL